MLTCSSKFSHFHSTNTSKFYRTCNLTSKFHFRSLHNEDSREITPAFFKKHIVQSITQLFGETVASCSIDLLKYNPKTKEAIIRVPSSEYVKIRASLSLCGDYEGVPCTYNILKAGACLNSLVSDSRKYKH